MKECIQCQCSLKGIGVTLPWEDDDNPYAYIRCPSCGCENIVAGYGEDDD